MSLRTANEIKAEAEFWTDALRNNTFGAESAAGIRFQIQELYRLAQRELSRDPEPGLSPETKEGEGK